MKLKEKVYKLPTVEIEEVRRMTEEDVTKVKDLLNKYLKKFKVHLDFSVDEIKHMFIPREGVLDSYVVEDKKGINGFVSFYVVPCLQVSKGFEYKGAYMLYYGTTKTPVKELGKIALNKAAKMNADIFFALDIMDSLEMFKVFCLNIDVGIKFCRRKRENNVPFL